MKTQKRPAKKRRQEKNQTFKVGDLIKISNDVPLVEDTMWGAVGMIISFNETDYPKGLTGRARDGTIYTVAAGGRNIRLFEDEMEMIC